MKPKEIQAVIGVGLFVGILIAGAILLQNNKKKSTKPEPNHD